MLKLLGPLIGAVGGGSIVSYGVLLAGAAGLGGIIYNHGKTVERGKQAERVIELVEERDRLADNYLQLAVNERVAGYEELRRVAARSSEIVAATERFFNASEKVRAEARRDVAEYRAELERIEADNEQFTKQLKEAHDAWLEQKTPFNLVCDIYSGVLDIDDCTRLRDTRAGGADENTE